MNLKFIRVVLKGKKHSKTSPLTERDYLKKDDFFKAQTNCKETNINPIMDEIKELKTDIKTLSKDFTDFRTELKELVAVIPYKVLDNTLKETDKLYANKITQTIVYGIVGLILTAVFGGLITLIIK